jgi:hypothetical protein
MTPSGSGAKLSAAGQLTLRSLRAIIPRGADNDADCGSKTGSLLPADAVLSRYLGGGINIYPITISLAPGTEKLNSKKSPAVFLFPVNQSLDQKIDCEDCEERMYLPGNV